MTQSSLSLFQSLIFASRWWERKRQTSYIVCARVPSFPESTEEKKKDLLALDLRLEV